MPDIGLDANSLSDIISIFKENPKIKAASVFGSRAKGCFKPYSDVDIALRGNCGVLDAEAVKCRLDDLPLAYTFDVVAYETITNPELLEHIDRVGVAVYSTE